MTTAFMTLSKMLELEREGNFEDKAVMGGLEKFISTWRQEATQAGHDPQVIEDIASLMADYSAADNRKARIIIMEKIATSLSTESRRPRRSPPVEKKEAETPAPDGKAPDTSHETKIEREQPPAPSRQEPRPQSHRQGEDWDITAGLKAPVTTLPRINTGYAKKLERLGVETVQDLLYLFPRRYNDFRNLKKINQLAPGEEVTIIGMIEDSHEKQTARGLTVITALVTDGTGTIQATWFNQHYLMRRLQPNRQIVLSGKTDLYLGRLVMQSPEWEPLEKELIHTNRLVPVYPLTHGISGKWMRTLMHKTVEYWEKRLPDHLTDEILQRTDLIPLNQAISQIHFPDNEESAEEAKHRLAFDEFLLIQLGVLRQRRWWRQEPARALQVNETILETFRRDLPFTLTKAQDSALRQILHDIQRPEPMSRLMQGDVGSGKTVVATAAMLITVANGCQAALMAPTEILAEQHHKTISHLLESLSIPLESAEADGRTERKVRIELLTGSVPKSERERIIQAIASGDIDILVGTHALIQDDVHFSDLALAIVDEQHRFGVAQRGALRQKGYSPHMLVMSATPIPRSLSLTIYGDLDLSIIDELPPGRQAIETRWLEQKERERAYPFIRSQIDKGRQAFIICPLVEDSDKIEAKAAVDEFERLSKEIFPDLRLGLLHGRMKAAEKEGVMKAFHRHEIHILVSTSVVEVGIDVPNATVMLVEGANRFGLAQLHQFRGRVGRSEHRSYCLLLADSDSTGSRDRLQAIEDTQDGFALAEKDLEMRGPGEFFGTQQSGLPPLKLAELGDLFTLVKAREEAQLLTEKDPELSWPEHKLLAHKLEEFWTWGSDLS